LLRIITVAAFVFTSVTSYIAIAEGTQYVRAKDAALQNGRYIWLQNCENCHGYGIADAPIPMQPSDWKHRVVKDREVLYDHAINGFIGEDYSSMPARGGNDELSDDHVKAAVDYMLFLANFYIEQQASN